MPTTTSNARRLDLEVARSRLDHLAVDVELGARRQLDRDRAAAGARDAALRLDAPRPQAVAAQRQRRPRAPPRSRPRPAPRRRGRRRASRRPPKAPVLATVTCQASPAKTSSPSQMTRHRTGDAVTAARRAPTAYASGPSALLRPLASRAATGARPALATLTNGRSSMRARSRRRVRSPSSASRQASATSSGRSRKRAKSLAVPTGITARGTPAPAAASAAQPIEPSPPATTIRSAPGARGLADAAGSRTPRPRLPGFGARAATSGASPPPDRGFASSAIRGLLPWGGTP